MSEHDAKLRLLELFGSILEVIDASSRDGRNCAIHWLEITAMKDGLLEQFIRWARLEQDWKKTAAESADQLDFVFGAGDGVVQRLAFLGDPAANGFLLFQWRHWNGHLGVLVAVEILNGRRDRIELDKVGERARLRITEQKFRVQKFCRTETH